MPLEAELNREVESEMVSAPSSLSSLSSSPFLGTDPDSAGDTKGSLITLGDLDPGPDRGVLQNREAQEDSDANVFFCVLLLQLPQNVTVLYQLHISGAQNK